MAGIQTEVTISACIGDVQPPDRTLRHSAWLGRINFGGNRHYKAPAAVFSTVETAVSLLLVICMWLTAAILIAPAAMAQTDLNGSYDRLLKAPIAADRAASALAWDCLATAFLIQAGKSGVTRLELIVNRLRAKGWMRGNRLVWGPEPDDKECGNGSKAFGHCNDPYTGYSFQSGMAIACLAEAAKILSDDGLRQEARRSLRYWDEFRLPAPCDGCVYYLFDDAPADADRYVRNANLFMGYAAAALGERALAEGAVKADIWERQGGNFGYFGRLDPQYDPERTEYHAAFVALFSLRIGRSLRFDRAIMHGLNVWRDWAKCANERCYTNTCAKNGADSGRCWTSATFVHCAFRQLDLIAAESCKNVLAQTKTKTLNSTMTFAFLSAE